MKILVAIDDTDESWDAVLFTRELIQSTDHHALVLNVSTPAVDNAMYFVDGFGAGNSVPSRLIEPDPAEVAQRLAAAKELVRESGEAIGTRELLVEVGSPVAAIVRVAEEHAVDLVVVGSHHKGWFARWFDGSVSRDLLEAAPCPVLVVT